MDTGSMARHEAGCPICQILPSRVLDQLANDPRFGDTLRQSFARSARVSDALRDVRNAASRLVDVRHLAAAMPMALAPIPADVVFDCGKTSVLPGSPVTNAATSTDATAQRAYSMASAVARFYQAVFARNSIDGQGMTLVSSVHYGEQFLNALWQGSEMVYGDGDGSMFLDFTSSDDVIAHELTHGVTQYSLRLAYTDGETGGLNESISDCFGSMFRQWRAGQDVHAADWLIGADMLGPQAHANNMRCLRNMADPPDPTAMFAQPADFALVTPNMDPHFASGPPNKAFATACVAVGGKSWERVGQVWYRVLTTSGALPTMGMADFAARTRQAAQTMFPGEPAVAAGVDAGWKAVGL